MLQLSPDYAVFVFSRHVCGTLKRESKISSSSHKKPDEQIWKNRINKKWKNVASYAGIPDSQLHVKHPLFLLNINKLTF